MKLMTLPVASRLRFISLDQFRHSEIGIAGGMSGRRKRPFEVQSVLVYCGTRVNRGGRRFNEAFAFQPGTVSFVTTVSVVITCSNTIPAGSL